MALIESIVVRYIRFDGCNVFISALELFNFILFTLLSLYFTFNPQRFVRLHLVGEYVPIFPTGFLGFRTRRCTCL